MMNILAMPFRWFLSNPSTSNPVPDATNEKVELVRSEMDLASAVKTSEKLESLDSQVEKVLQAAKTQQNGIEGYNPNMWTLENFNTATRLLENVSQENRSKEQQSLQILVNRYWEPRNEIIALIKAATVVSETDPEVYNYDSHKWAPENFNKAKELVEKFPEGISDRDKLLLKVLQELIEAYTPSPSKKVSPELPQSLAKETPVSSSPVVSKKKVESPKLFPLNNENVAVFCASLGDSMTKSQTEQARYFLQEYDKIASKAPQDLQESIGALKVLIPSSKGAQDYLVEIKAILEPLLEPGGYNLDKLTKEKCCEAVRLLKVLQRKNLAGSEEYQQYKRRLERVITAYVRRELLNPQDENQAREAIAFLSFSRMQGSALPMLGFETELRDSINAHVAVQIDSFPPNPQALPVAPIGIANVDGSSCFAGSVLQIFVNNSILSAVYKASFPKQHCALVIDEYNKVRREGKKTVGNIRVMRAALGGAQGQQDANELVNHLHNKIEIDANGKVGGVKFGVRINEHIKNLLTGKNESRPYTSNPLNPYAIPSRQLGFDLDDLNPSLSSMMNCPVISETRGGQVETTLHFAEVPEVFVYQFTRLVNGRVNRTEVEMPLYQTIEATDDTTGYLQLQGFIRHLGDSGVGHYISYMVQNGKFWKADDVRISEISAADYLIAARHATTAVYSTVKKTKSEQKTE